MTRNLLRILGTYWVSQTVTLLLPSLMLISLIIHASLFIKTGAIWGRIIDFCSSEDWFYLFVLYSAINFIRLFLVLLFFPITSKLSIGQSLREGIFMVFAGLRALLRGILPNIGTQRSQEVLNP